MSGARDFFRICPACGRRFHIKLVNEKLVDDRKHVEEMKKAMASPSGIPGKNLSFIVVEEDVPVVIDIKDFQYTYKCKHCGHVWSETREKQSRS